MVEYLSPSLDPVFHALGDGTRRAMLRQLAQSPRTVSELAAPYEMSLAAASKHIKVLEAAGLISREVQGRTHTCHLNAAPLASAQSWLEYYEKFWTGRFDALEALLKADDAAKSQEPKPKSKTTAKPGVKK